MLFDDDLQPPRGNVQSLSIALYQEMIEQIDRIADRYHISRSAAIRLLLAKQLESERMTE